MSELTDELKHWLDMYKVECKEIISAVEELEVRVVNAEHHLSYHCKGKCASIKIFEEGAGSKW